MDEEFLEYLFVTGQLDETFGLKNENDNEIEDEEENEYSGRSR